MEKVTFYKEKFYQGNGVAMDVGWYDYDVLKEFGLNDAIKSVRVPSGMTVRLCKDKWLSGDCLTLDCDSPDLGSFNNQASSWAVDSNDSTPRPTIFHHPDYRGRRQYLEVGGHAYGDVNANIWVGQDAVSSVQVPEGFLVALFEHNGYKGRVYGLTSDIRDLAQLHFNDMTSCILVYHTSQFEPELRSCPAPAIPKLHGYDYLWLPQQTEQLLRAEALVPFSFVSDPQLAPNMQAQNSPFYRLAREEVWEMVMGYHHPGGGTYHKGTTVKTGMTKSEATTVKQTLSVEIDRNGGLGFTLFGIGFDLRVSTKINQQLETTLYQSGTEMEEKIYEIA